MIEVYTGTPGSGKSAHAARQVRYALTRPGDKRPVIANFPLGTDAPVPAESRGLFTHIPNEEMSAGKIIDLANEYWDSGVHRFEEDWLLLCLDECQLFFNSRRWSDKSRMSYLEFLSQSRKYGVKVILIAQSAKMIDNQFRMLIEVEHNHRRVTSMGPLGMLVAMPFGNRLSLDVRYLFQTNERLGMDLLLPNKRDFAMYDSYARFDKVEG